MDEPEFDYLEEVKRSRVVRPSFATRDTGERDGSESR